VLTAFPSGLVASIPSAIPKNPVGSYQLLTGCVGRSTDAFVRASRMSGIRTRLLRRYRQTLFNAIPTELGEATIPIAVAPPIRKHTTRAATAAGEMYQPLDRKMLHNLARKHPKHQPAHSIPCQGTIMDSLTTITAGRSVTSRSEALQHRTVSTYQSGVSTRPLEERRA
jgi:hypothetical protein